MTNETALAAALAATDKTLAILDLSAELEAIAAVKAEEATLNEAYKRAQAERSDIAARLGKLSSAGFVPDPEEAAAAFLAGEATEAESEDVLRAKSAELGAVLQGLDKRLRDVAQAQVRAKDELRKKLGTAAEPLGAALLERTMALLNALEEVRGVAKVAGTALRSGKLTYLDRALEEVRSAWNREKLRADPLVSALEEAPPWLLDFLDQHRAVIERGQGQILRHVTPPREPKVERERPEPTPYIPGRGGNVPIQEGGIAISNI